MSSDRSAQVPAWDAPRSPSAARDVVDCAIERGFTAEACLAGTGLSLADLGLPDTVLQADQELGAIRNLMSLTGDPAGLGVEVGLRYKISSAGILGFAVLSSATVREALEVVERYATLGSMFHAVALDHDAAGAALTLSDRGTPTDVRQFVLERDLAAMTQVLPVVFAGRQLAAGIALELVASRDESGGLAALAEVIPVRFGSARNAVTFSGTILDGPLAAADEHTARTCVQQCERLLATRRHRAGAAGTVRSRLLRDPGELPSMTQVAAELSITTRALRRRLALSGTSFRALVEEVRDTIAGELLANGLTVEQVARSLGYSETAGFTHAYTRWHGVPPSHHRVRG